jgi:hypothetical protein
MDAQTYLTPKHQGRVDSAARGIQLLMAALSQFACAAGELKFHS